MYTRVSEQRPILTLALFILLATLLAACGATASPTPTPEPSPTAVPPTQTPGPSYDNPVYRPDFPDPFVLRVDNDYYAYSTSAGRVNVPTIHSTTLTSWQFIGDAFPAPPAWVAITQGLWAPGVLARGDTFVLYYSLEYMESGRRCISRAVSQAPDGPFVDDSAEPFICQTELGGAIDPHPFVDADGAPYLLWKNDGNCCGLAVKIWVQPLSEDGLSLLGEPVELIERDQAWERPLVENPAMWAHDGDYYLFYSGNWWGSHEYAVGYAVCESVTGPCVKPQQEPVFSFTPTVMGPGGQVLFTDAEDNLWMAYHAWTGPDVGYPGGIRSFRIDPVTFEDGRPVILGPTDDPQPLP